MNALLLVLGLVIPRDTVLVAIVLVPTNDHVVVEAVMEADSTLLLPSAAVRDLLGVQMVGPWTSLDQLRRAYPTITVRWSPEMGQVVVWDELHVLPATRRFYETHRASAFGTMAIPVWSGPFAAVAVDDARRGLLDLGYTYKGRLSLATRVDDQGTTQWGLSAAPSRYLFVSSSGGTRRAPQVSGRVQAGPLWISANYTPHQPLDAAGLLRVGPASVFVSRAFAVLTLQPDPWWSVQVARTATGRTLGRIGWGPITASPFSLPFTSLSR